MRLFPFLIPDDPGFFRIHKSRDAGQDDYAETSGMRAAGWRRRGGTTRSVRLFRAGVDDPEDCINRTILHRLQNQFHLVVSPGLPANKVSVGWLIKVKVFRCNAATICTPVTFCRNVIPTRNVVRKFHRLGFHSSPFCNVFLLSHGPMTPESRMDTSPAWQ